MNLPPIESAGALLRSVQNAYPDDFVKKLIRLFGTKLHMSGVYEASEVPENQASWCHY